MEGVQQLWQRRTSRKTLSSENPMFSDLANTTSLISVLQIADVLRLLERFTGTIKLELRHVCKQIEFYITEYTSRLRLCVLLLENNIATRLPVLYSLVRKFVNIQHLSLKLKLYDCHEMLVTFSSKPKETSAELYANQIALILSVCFSQIKNVNCTVQGVVDLLPELRAIDTFAISNQAGDMYEKNKLQLDVSSLSNVKSLSKAKFEFVDLVNMEAMRSCCSLSELCVEGTDIFDWENCILSCGSLLKFISIDSNISNLNALHGCKSLIQVSVRSTKVVDVAGLAGCKSLLRLDCSHTLLSDITALATCTSLTHLFLNSTQVTDISALGSCTRLRELNLKSTKIFDVSALGNCTSLRELDLSYTKVSDVSALTNCPSLIELKLQFTSVADMTALGNCIELAELYLSNTQVCDISVLKKCTSITILHLDCTQVSDISVVHYFTKLEDLSLSSTLVSDVACLASCTNLTIVNLDHLGISDLTALGNCTKLKQLHLADTCVSDLTPLYNCTLLSMLIVSHSMPESEITELEKVLNNILVLLASYV